MEAAEAAAVAGERKAVTRLRSQWKRNCGAPGSDEAWPEKTRLGGAEWQGARELLLQDSVPCMPVASQAANYSGVCASASALRSLVLAQKGN
jgi:hypothetical protein